MAAANAALEVSPIRILPNARPTAADDDMVNVALGRPLTGTRDLGINIFDGSEDIAVWISHSLRVR
jgi:hypothetical protein